MTATIAGWSTTLPDLRGATALVVGGTGGVGEGVVRSLRAAGADVVATGRDSHRLDAFARRLAGDGGQGGQLHTARLDGLAADLDRTVESLVAEHGRFSVAVVSVASWGDQGRKPVLALTDEEWDALVAANLTVVFRLYRALVPALAVDGMLVQLNGLSADLPFPGAGGVALTAAATKSLTRTLAAELGRGGPRVHELVLGVVRTRARQLAGVDDERWIDSTQIGAHVASLAAGTSALGGDVLQYFTDRVAGPQPAPAER